MLNAWKYSFDGHYLVLARKGDFAGVPDDIVKVLEQATPVEWGDRPSEPLKTALGMDRSEIERELSTKGFVYSKPYRV